MRHHSTVSSACVQTPLATHQVRITHRASPNRHSLPAVLERTGRGTVRDRIGKLGVFDSAPEERRAVATGGAARRRSRPTRNPWKRDPPIPPPADIQQSRARQEAVLPFLSYRSLMVAALLLIRPRPLLGSGALNTYAAGAGLFELHRFRAFLSPAATSIRGYTPWPLSGPGELRPFDFDPG